MRPTISAPAVADEPAGATSSTATPAPAWLGTRVLSPGPTGFPPPQPTPSSLLPRRIATVDLLPPPTDPAFDATVSEVPQAVAARSTWHPACPVSLEDLRYVTVTFFGFDGRPHTGELLVHVDAVTDVLAIFETMHATRFPLEQVAIIGPDDLDAPATGDGNVTTAFVCRPITTGGSWSEHAYGRALDVNPFQNPYVRNTTDGRIVIPELATAYTDRALALPGMLTADHPVLDAVSASGWHWGGDYESLTDPMHLSATGR